jgi:hypothetical protein
MADQLDTRPPTEWERDQAREHVTQRLAAVSAAIWAIGMIAFMVFWFPSGSFRPSIGAVVASYLLALAALPWVTYSFLVNRAIRARRRAARGDQ